MKRELIHGEALDIDDIVQMDLGMLGEAVEEYVFRYCKEHDLDHDEIHYEWSHPVVVKIYRKG